MLRAAAVALALVAAIAAPAAAAPAKRLRAMRVDEAPAIDGAVDDPAWRRARWVSDFLQSAPVERGAPSQPTRVAIVYDDDALYVAAVMQTGGPDDLEAPMTRRDDTGTAERIIVSLDTFRDRRTAYSFAVTAAGVRADWFHPDDATFPRDASFDAVWSAEISRHSDHWIAEMRIPFSQLRFPSRGAHWGINLNRYIPHKNEDLFWVVVPNDVAGWSSYFGELDGLDDVAPPLRLELLPYLAGDATITSSSLIDEADPFAERLDLGGRAGIDGKLGLGPNLTLDATINPDFGQVEADPAVVNLSAFETVFDERRPFFVEGNQLLATPVVNYFYSRRIGGAPRGEVSAEFSDVPSATPIWGATKLTGRLPGRVSIGALAALTAPVDARIADAGSDEREQPVESLATYGVLRVQKEFGGSSSRVGATLTSVHRAHDDPALAAQAPRQSTTGGVDFQLRSADAAYEVGGLTGFSAISGDADAIARLQQSTAHLFQRPDQDHARFDPTRESLDGWLAIAYGGKRSGNWRWSALVGAESPGLDLNDAGILQSADDASAQLATSYQNNVPGWASRRWEVGLNGVGAWNFGGDRQPAGIAATGRWTLPNFWELSGELSAILPGQDDALTRGGPAMGVGWGGGGVATVKSSFAARTAWAVTASVDSLHAGPSGLTASGELTLRPIDRLRLSVLPRYHRGWDNRQFIAHIEGAGGPTFDSRYVFATVFRRELALQTRAQLAFDPDLTLELYVEPFASSGRFAGFGELAAAGSRDLRRYGDDGSVIQADGDQYRVTDGADAFGFANPDFTILSLRSTVVLRWEFRPGSTLFAVWQQDRADRLAEADARVVRGIGDSAGAPGTHVIALKLTTWWSIH